MNYFKDKEFTRALQIGYILALFFLILLFLSFPDFTIPSRKKIPQIDVNIYVEQIPQTKQNLIPRRRRPIVSEMAIPVPVETEDLPEELPLDSLMYEKGELGDLAVGGRSVEIPAKPILEIYPEVNNLKCKGIIRLLLLVNKNGDVEDIEVLENTTGNAECLKKTLEAARLSKWRPAKVGKEFVSSWVEKKYKINVK